MAFESEAAGPNEFLFNYPKPVLIGDSPFYYKPTTQQIFRLKETGELVMRSLTLRDSRMSCPDGTLIEGIYVPMDTPSM